MQDNRFAAISFRAILLTLLTILWMLLIFHMSSAVEDESRAQSGVICEFLCETFVEGYEEMPPAQQLQMQERFSFPVRKGAHLTEYTVLGILLTLTAASYRPGDVEAYRTSDMASGQVSETASYRTPGPTFRRISRRELIPLLIGFLYAVSDEIHQHFVPGRAMQARDVLIDTAGVLLGIWIVYGVSYGVTRTSVP